MDLRGHGLSDKPVDGYADSGLWADDVTGWCLSSETAGLDIVGAEYVLRWPPRGTSPPPKGRDRCR